MTPVSGTETAGSSSGGSTPMILKALVERVHLFETVVHVSAQTVLEDRENLHSLQIVPLDIPVRLVPQLRAIGVRFTEARDQFPHPAAEHEVDIEIGLALGIPRRLEGCNFPSFVLCDFLAPGTGKEKETAPPKKTTSRSKHFVSP